MQNAMTAAPEKGAKTEPVDHRKQDRTESLQVAGHSYGCERQDYPNDSYRCRRPAGTRRHAGIGKPREP